MTKKTRAILDIIDNELVKKGKTAHELWNVLTALRSCDLSSTDQNSAHDLKESTTIPIRRAAFPRVARLAGTKSSGGVLAIADFQPISPFRCDHGGSHFGYHVLDAARVLGLVEE